MKTIITVVVVLAFVLLFIWPGVWTGGVPVWTWMTGETTAQFFRPPSFQHQQEQTVPEVEFNIGLCQPFSSATGMPIDKAASLKKGFCFYSYQPAQAPEAPTAPEAPAQVAPVTGKSAYSEPLNGHRLQSGETWTVPQGWSCSGDLIVNGIAYFDNNPQTGEVGTATKDVIVEAPYGGFCDPSPATVKANQLKLDGCEGNNGCVSVREHNW